MIDVAVVVKHYDYYESGEEKRGGEGGPMAVEIEEEGKLTLGDNNF